MVCVIGLLTGVLNALLGIGGGAVIVPALVLWAGYQQKEAQAASLWYVVPTSLFAGFLYKSGSLDVRLEYVAAMVASAPRWSRESTSGRSGRSLRWPSCALR